MIIPIGTEVMVNVCTTDWIPDNPTRALNGKTFLVKKFKTLATGTGARSNRTTYYELYGATSKYGIPYSFTEEDLMVL